jgi:hypothetical protein
MVEDAASTRGQLRSLLTLRLCVKRVVADLWVFA